MELSLQPAVHTIEALLCLLACHKPGWRVDIYKRRRPGVCVSVGVGSLVCAAVVARGDTEAAASRALLLVVGAALGSA
jgi:hypothetical protein